MPDSVNGRYRCICTAGTDDPQCPVGLVVGLHALVDTVDEQEYEDWATARNKQPLPMSDGRTCAHCHEPIPKLSNYFQDVFNVGDLCNPCHKVWSPIRGTASDC